MISRFNINTYDFESALQTLHDQIRITFDDFGQNKHDGLHALYHDIHVAKCRSPCVLSAFGLGDKLGNAFGITY